MSRLPRRPSRVKPPLRGRAATQHYRGEFAPVASVRRPLRAYGSRTLLPSQERKQSVVCKPEPDSSTPKPPPSLYADLVKFYKSWVRFLQDLNQPWQWLLAIAVVLTGLLLLSQLR
ncbi:MAG: hypothetical protein ACFB2W_03875 [Leptolyngbyaceae cyanobacterium]